MDRVRSLKHNHRDGVVFNEDGQRLTGIGWLKSDG